MYFPGLVFYLLLFFTWTITIPNFAFILWWCFSPLSNIPVLHLSLQSAYHFPLPYLVCGDNFPHGNHLAGQLSLHIRAVHGVHVCLQHFPDGGELLAWRRDSIPTTSAAVHATCCSSLWRDFFLCITSPAIATIIVTAMNVKQMI